MWAPGWFISSLLEVSLWVYISIYFDSLRASLILSPSVFPIKKDGILTAFPVPSSDIIKWSGSSNSLSSTIIPKIPPYFYMFKTLLTKWHEPLSTIIIALWPSFLDS